MSSTIVVAGQADSEDLAIAYSVLWAAKQKYGRLFQEKVIRILPEEYDEWLQNTLKENKWGKHDEEVITWVELGFKGGPKDLIGGLDMFLEYMYESYKVLRPIKRERAENVAKKTVDQMRSDDFLCKLEASKSKRYFTIAIIGACHKATPALVYELLRARFCIDHHGTVINLYDSNPQKLAEMKEKADDLNNMEGLLNDKSTIKTFTDMTKAVEYVRLIIFLGDESIKSGDNIKLGKQLRLCYYLYKEIAETIDPFLNPDVRVVFTCMDFRCFNASVFTRYSTVNKNLVMVITSHLALEACSYMAKATGLPQSHFLYQSSIVWGCVGLSHCVDLSNGDILYNMMRFKNNQPPEDYETMEDITKEFKHEYWGEDNWILRKQDYLVQSLKFIWYYVGRQKESLQEYMNSKTYISQVKATIDTLDCWYDPNPKGKPLSAGIYSDGSYGFPTGFFMSQPITIEKWTYELKVKPDVIKSKDLLNLIELATFPLGIVKKLIHGNVFTDLIADENFLGLVEKGDDIIKERLEAERLEKERVERERLMKEEAEEEMEEEEIFEEAVSEQVEEEQIQEQTHEQIHEKISEAMEEEESEIGESKTSQIDAETVQEEEVQPTEPDFRSFLDATFVPETSQVYYIGLGDKSEPMLESELNEEQKEFLNLINEYRGKTVKDAYILRKKEIYPPNGIRQFDRRPDRNKDPAYAAVCPQKFIDVPVLTIQWPEIKRVIERLQQLKKKSRKQILDFYANKVMQTFKAREKKLQKQKYDRTISVDNFISDDDLDSDFDVTPKLKKFPLMDTSFLFKHDFKIKFDFHDSRPFHREFTEALADYEKRVFISALQFNEDVTEQVYHKHAKSLKV